MIPILYAPNASSFTNNGLGPLSDCVSAVVHEQRNGVFELEIHMPTGGLHFSEIGLGSLIKAKPSPTRTAQLFSVYSIEKSLDGMMAAIYCEHVSYRLSLIPVLPFTANSASQALSRLYTNAVEPCPFTFSTDVTRAGTYKQTIPSSMRARLQGEQGSILQVYQGEFEFDNFNVNLWLNRGQDRGVVIEYGKNIKTLQQDASIQNVITGILPYWTGMEGETETTVMLPEYILYSSHASDFPNARTICVDMSQDFTEKPTEAQLRTAGNKYITDNNIGVPDIGFDVDFALLAQSLDYKDTGLAERVELCDIVTVRFTEWGIDAQAKVVEAWFDVLRERYDKVRIGNQRFTLSNTIAQQSQDIVASEARQTSWFQQALDQATALINGDLTGASMITQTDSAGNPVGLIFMDTADPATAVNCIRINSSGIGFSNNGPQGPYSSTWDIRNTMNMANINVINLVVDHLLSYAYNQAQNLEWKLESQAGELTMSTLWNNLWHRLVILQNTYTIASGTLMQEPNLQLSTIGIDEEGNPISGYDPLTSYLSPLGLHIGEDQNGNISEYGDLRVGTAYVNSLFSIGSLSRNEEVTIAAYNRDTGTYQSHMSRFYKSRGNDGIVVWAIGGSDEYSEENSGGENLLSGTISRGGSGTIDVTGYQAIVMKVLVGSDYYSLFMARNQWKTNTSSTNYRVGDGNSGYITTSYNSTTKELTISIGSSSYQYTSISQICGIR